MESREHQVNVVKREILVYMVYMVYMAKREISARPVFVVKQVILVLLASVVKREKQVEVEKMACMESRA